MSQDEPQTLKSLADVGYSKEQLEKLSDLAKSADHQVFGGFVTSLPINNPSAMAPTIDAVKALDGRIFAMLDASELETLEFYRAQGRKFGGGSNHHQQS